MLTKLETIPETRNSYVMSNIQANNNRYNRNTSITTPTASNEADGAFDMLSNSYSFLPIVCTP